MCKMITFKSFIFHEEEKLIYGIDEEEFHGPCIKDPRSGGLETYYNETLLPKCQLMSEKSKIMCQMRNSAPNEKVSPSWLQKS